MAITVFLTCFISFFISLLILSGREEKLSLVFIKAVILFSVILVGATEFLSAFHLLLISSVINLFFKGQMELLTHFLFLKVFVS